MRLIMATRALILLTLNEVEGVRALGAALTALRPQVDELVAVDGGSTDGTRDALGVLGVRIVDQATPGRGAAFRAAVEATSGERLVFFSPDGNEDPADIPRLFDALAQGADLAIASRFLPGARNEEDGCLLPLRKWANQAFTWLANRLWNRGAYVTDTINGFRGMTRAAFARCATTSTGYSIEYEMTIHAMKLGLRIAELPTREADRIGGCSKAPSFRTGCVFLGCVMRELRSGARSAAVGRA